MIRPLWGGQSWPTESGYHHLGIPLRDMEQYYIDLDNTACEACLPRCGDDHYHLVDYTAEGSSSCRLPVGAAAA